MIYFNSAASFFTFFTFILILYSLLWVKSAEAVNSCYAGTIYPGSLYLKPVKTYCPSGVQDACLKVYSNTGSATSYSCAAKASCSTSVSLNGVTSNSVCCYTDNCNSGIKMSKINDGILLILSIFAIKFFY